MKVKTCRAATNTCSRKQILLLLCPLKGSNRNQTKMVILVSRTNHFQHVTKPLQVTSITSFRYLVPQPKGRGEILFWYGSCRLWHPGCSLSALYLLNQLVEFDQTCTDTLLGGRKEVVRFWWHWPHFEGHTSTLKFSNFDQKRLSACYPLKQRMDSDQISYIL